jgi:hypothetical protein
MSGLVRDSLAWVLSVTLLAALGLAETGRAAEEQLVRVAASDRYEAARLHRFTFGGGYRDLWETEIELPVLDLANTGGGIVPTARFGGLQTAVLGFKGPDGRAYTFRGTDKDPSTMLDDDLLDTVVQTMVQDQMAAQNPGAPPVVSRLAEAAGLLAIQERLMVMPDDPALGEFREEFAGMVGAFYEFPTPATASHAGFHGATEIIDHKELYERLERGGESVDAEAFLRARLFDVLIGDFDRHRKQWRWARLPGDPRWKPIPEDRDMAFVRYDGAGIRAASLYFPILQNFGPKYSSISGLTLHGWEQDRWLLPALSWEQWDAIARDIQSRISNRVIDLALGTLPVEYAAVEHEQLRSTLRARRDALHEAARSYYEHLAGQVDVQTSNAGERVEVTRDDDGGTLVEVSSAAGGSAPIFSRRFEAGETRDVRIYLRDGDDRVRVTGSPGCLSLSGCVHLRVIAGTGEKTLDDSQGGGTEVYDEHDSIEVTRGTLTRVHHSPYEPPESDSGFVDVDDVPARDWGSEIIPIPVIGYERDVGVFVGAGAIYKRFAFRKHPWSSRYALSGGWATEANEPRIKFDSSFRLERTTNLLLNFDILYSGMEVLRWYGYGNETSDDGDDSFYRVRNRLYYAAPSFTLAFDEDRLKVGTGLYVGNSKTKDDDRFINVDNPYGSGDFGLMSFFVTGRYDTRRLREKDASGMDLRFHENPAAGYPVSGFLVDLRADVSPPALDVESTWGSVEGTASVYLTGRGEEWGRWGWLERFTLALRAGGRATFGKVPYFQAAFIGGGDFFSGHASVRGFRDQRFAGDYAFFNNNELRVFLFRTKLLVPGDVGLIGFADVGRVFVDGESSNKWHVGGGGGVWFAPLSRANTISLSVANSEEETLVYMRMGFHF